MSNSNLYTHLRAGFPADADRLAITTDTGRRWSWGELDALSAQLAGLLGSLAEQPVAGEVAPRLAAVVGKSVEALALYLASLRAGWIFLPLNPAFQAAELAYFLGDAEPRVVVCTGAHRAAVEAIAGSAGVAQVFTLEDDGSGSLLAAAAGFRAEHAIVAREASDLAAMVYTSGTTGRSKGALLSHGNLLANAQVLRGYWDWQPDDVLIHALPIFHVHGLFVACHGALLNGSPMRWHARFDAARVLAELPRASLFMGVPTMYLRMLAEPALDRRQAAGMRLFVSGSAPLSASTWKAWEARCGHRILERYGMSETGMLVSNPCSADARHGGSDERRPGTVGFPLPGVELRICDEADRELPTGEVGGVQVRGAGVFSGYWRMPEKTAAAFTADGWFRTGDLGARDAEGRVTLAGRSSDLLISGGFNIYPAEIEQALDALPGVLESAVIGVPHQDLGEAGVALVVARTGAVLQPQALLEALAGQLARYKLPRRCLLVDRLPRNAMGKVQKKLLREEYRGLFAG